MDILDEKNFINSLSRRLDLFKWKSDRRATCRCPLCGDSKKFKNKCRGEFFIVNKQFLFKCHNCGRCLTVSSLLKEVDSELWKTYVFTLFKDKKVYTRETPKITKLVDDDIPLEEIPIELGTSCDKLPEEHMAVQYLNSRKIAKQHFGNFYHCENFGKLMRYFAKDPNGCCEPRLIIPFFVDDKLIGVQGRSYEKDATIRYISLKRKEDIKMIFGFNELDFNDRIYIVEGPFDSLFLPNSCAVAGVSNMFFLPEQFLKADRVFILDNQPRNKEVCKIMSRLIDSHESIVIWPEGLEEKDINDMVLAHGSEYMLDIVQNNVYSGPEAAVRFAQWRKCGILDNTNRKVM